MKLALLALCGLVAFVLVSTPSYQTHHCTYTGDHAKHLTGSDVLRSERVVIHVVRERPVRPIDEVSPYSSHH